MYRIVPLLLTAVTVLSACNTFRDPSNRVTWPEESGPTIASQGTSGSCVDALQVQLGRERAAKEALLPVLEASQRNPTPATPEECRIVKRVIDESRKTLDIYKTCRPEDGIAVTKREVRELQQQTDQLDAVYAANNCG